MARTSDLVESMAIAAAAACLAHCIALPLVMAALPALAVVMPIPTSFHIVVLIFAIPTTLFALGIGWRAHRRPLPLAAGVVGLGLLAIAVLRYEGTPDEVLVTIPGSLLIAGAHVANWRLRRHHHGHAHPA